MRRLLLLLFAATLALCQTLPPNHICRLRCIAKCLDNKKEPFPNCTQECASYDNQKLCTTPQCWDVCNDLGPAGVLPTPRNISLNKTNGANTLNWSPVRGATLYALMYKLPTANRFDGDDYMITTNTQLKDFQNPKGTVCDGADVMVMAVAASALSPLSSSESIDAPSPYVSPSLDVQSLVYIDQPFIREGYDANGTLSLTFKYHEQEWPLGPSDLIVEPLFHMISCAQPDLSKAIPLPDFTQGPQNTVNGLLGADMMYRQCRFMYYVQSVSSKWCGTRTSIRSPPPNAIKTMIIGCDTVTNAPCKKEIRHEPPVCGQVDDVEYQVLDKNLKESDQKVDLTLNVSFTPIVRSGEPPTLYYVAFYGPAQNYSSDDQRAFLGVNMTQIMANSTNCDQLTPQGICAHPTNTSVIVFDIHMDNLYGIIFCAIKDPLNLVYPDFFTESKAYRPKANPIYVNSKVLHVNLTRFSKNYHNLLLDNSYENEELAAREIVDLLRAVGYVERGNGGAKSVDDQQWETSKQGTVADLTNRIQRSTDNETNMAKIPEDEDGVSYDPVGIILEYANISLEEEPNTEASGEGITIIRENNSTDIFDFNSTSEIVLESTSTPTTTRTAEVDQRSHYAGKSPVGLIIGVVIGSLFVLLAVSCGVCFFINKRQKAKNQKFRLKITQLELEKESRYTDFPKKFDIWEIERRNLVIHNDKKLGSGAFGAVYLGKLLGKSLGHKDATSPLGVNLMRAENCEVAVKMLPEYADELSKSEFLREIGLMKTLGYHERLVNMLACITDSEPLCLIVEYCSDGDLLHFLRSRCKYMMKLDELGVDYHSPPVDDNYDITMIITLKQLLMFAVQISYGLEYLSQKGFVHRDVAARNILVHELNSCKIGDFGLCRYIYSENSHYKSKGGRLPLKWMSPEAIRHYEFSNKSDVWSFGILLFEIITLGGSPYPGVQPEDMLTFLEAGGRMEQPDNCPDDFYSIMNDCWFPETDNRPEFSVIRQKLAGQLEEITEEYSYLKLDAQKDYYNVQYGDQKPDIIIVPEDEPIKLNKKIASNGSLSSVGSIPRDAVIFDPNDDIDRMKAANKRQKEEDTQSSLITDSLSISTEAMSDGNV